MAETKIETLKPFQVDLSFATPRITLLTFLFLFLTLIGVAAGVYGLIVGHHHICNTTREIPWGILISGYIYFAIMSTGLCILSVLGHLFGGTSLLPLSNRSLYLSIFAILAAFLIIGLELENPWRMFWMAITPNPTSNIMWMGALYGACVAFMLLEFVLILSKRYALAFALGLLGALTEIAANTNLGAVFALIAARPFWYGAQLPIYFITSALMTGAAALIFFNYIAYEVRQKAMDEAMQKATSAAGKVLLLFLIAVSLATIWRFLAIFTGGSDKGRLAALALLNGPLAFNFWFFEIALGLVFPIIILVFGGLRNIHAMFLASLITLIGAFFQRYDLVVAGQIVHPYHGLFEGIPKYLSYSPSIFELLMIMGGASLLVTGFLIGERYFAGVFESREH
ncbi:NrfD/PsrC family molybdoenzyme membrane anchor subunit [Thermodesulfatator autotrophicus]|uniref:Polysulfide reductase NrfD n=1 Tax=Thermodesulfatator autotrophicus TaxID=1795632 RepID=A0A177E6D9_9BACT|nr:NrfD/PsrC family molybdoenzyme membrane anchor subunit [Thermodesulfatator autotrophicus]OAG27061.1 polysulfide reductase NrfD [Thermodesulfatator autotrophicus]